MRWLRDITLPAKVGTNFVDQWRPLGIFCLRTKSQELVCLNKYMILYIVIYTSHGNIKILLIFRELNRTLKQNPAHSFGICMQCDSVRKAAVKNKQTPWPLVRERTIPTDRPPLVDEI
jgi:hypothetical protein